MQLLVEEQWYQERKEEKKRNPRDTLLANLFVTPDQIKDHIKIENTLK